jgi:CubicO group peptidase (beta-lactamase class C family)
MENRAMKSGTGISFLSLLLASAFFCGCVSDAPFKFEGSTVPEELDDGWEIAAPAAVNIDQADLDEVYADFVSEDQYYNAKSLLVVKDGKLVFEAYCRNPKDRDRYGHIQSATKSVISLIFGIVQSEGHFASLDQTLYSIMPEKFPSGTAKRSIALRHLLTMTSGLDFDNDDFSLAIYGDKPKDPVKFLLNKPLYAQPGEEFYYRDTDPHLLSYAIQRSTGRTLERWAQERLFDPLDIQDYYWGSDHTGISMGAHGLHLKPRDMAKIGQMVLEHGRWKGTQIVDSTWVAVSTQAQMETGHTSEPHVYHYGYYWWILPRWEAFTAWGHGGNYIFIMPAKEMVIVMTALPDADNDVMKTNLEDFEQLITPLLE